MTFQIEPPLEARHKVGILLMVVAGLAACILFNLWIEANIRHDAAVWSNRERSHHHERH